MALVHGGLKDHCIMLCQEKKGAASAFLTLPLVPLQAVSTPCYLVHFLPPKLSTAQ